MKKTTKKNNNGKFIIGFIIFLTILITFTIGAIYVTINYLKENNKQSVQENESEIESEIEKNEPKKVAEDSKYAIQSYADTYDINSIKITNYYDINGNITKELPNSFDKYINYIQIEGLKNTDIQTKVNERLKQEAYKIKGNTRITANFSNVLSVGIYNENERSCLNINLVTGEDIPFEKLFTQSTPINAILEDALYETLAWAEFANNDATEEYSLLDMDKADISIYSDYEDNCLLLVNNYNKLQGNIKYNFYANQVLIYDLLDKSIVQNYKLYQNYLTLDLTKYPEQVAIFKRYLTENSIYENNDIGCKNIIVLTNDDTVENEIETLSYGKISDNIFMEEIIIDSSEFTDNESKMIKKLCTDLSNSQKNKLKAQFNNDTGVFYQREYHIRKCDDTLSDCYNISIDSYQTTCDFEYFENLAFKDYIELKKIPNPNGTIKVFSEYEYETEDFPNLKMGKEKHEEYYYNKNGEFIGNSEEEAKSKIQVNTTKNDIVQENVEQEQILEESEDNQDIYIEN